MPNAATIVMAMAVMLCAAAHACAASKTLEDRLAAAKKGVAAAQARIKKNQAEIAKLKKTALANPQAQKAEAEHERLSAEADAAQAEYDVQRKRVLDKLVADEPRYPAAVRAADAAEAKLDSLKGSGKATERQIADAARAHLEAEAAVTLLEKAALESDGEALAAREALDLAKSRAAAARRRAVEARVNNPTRQRLADLERDLGLAQSSLETNRERAEKYERQIAAEKKKK